jgi:hypothetical protein
MRTLIMAEGSSEEDDAGAYLCAHQHIPFQPPGPDFLWNIVYRSVEIAARQPHDGPSGIHQGSPAAP